MGLLLCLLQNNLLSVEMLFEVEKPRLLYFKQHLDTEEVILQQTQQESHGKYYTIIIIYIEN